MDGDFQHHPNNIQKIINNFVKLNSDITVGKRDLTSTKKTKLSIFRLGSSIIVTYIINLLLGKKTSDPLSGFFLFKKKIFEKNKKYLFSKGYKILADLLYSTRSELFISEVEIKFDNRSKGKSKMNINILIILVTFIFYKFKKRIFNY